MFRETLLRFLIGGAVVSVFAVLGDLFNPKSFAGLFGAASSVALATLGLAVVMEGRSYAATEARSMAGGALAFFVYASCVRRGHDAVQIASSTLVENYRVGSVGRSPTVLEEAPCESCR